jgi:hypothetical protein
MYVSGSLAVTEGISGAIGKGVTPALLAEAEAALTVLELALSAVHNKKVVTGAAEALGRAVVALVEAGSEHAGVSRHGAGCLGAVAAAAGSGEWPASTLQAWNTLLTLTVHSAPKTRRTAQEAVLAVLGSKGFSGRKHAASQQATKFVAHVTGSCNAKDTIPTLHSLHGASLWLPHLPPSLAAETLASILKLPALGLPHVGAAVFRSAEGLFGPDIKLNGKQSAEAISMILDAQPNRLDAAAFAAFASALTTASVRVQAIDEDAMAKVAPRVVEAVFSGFLSADEAVHAACAQGLSTLVPVLLSDAAINAAVAAARASAAGHAHAKKTPLLLDEVVGTLVQGLEVRFNHSYRFVMDVIAAVFQRLGDAGGLLLPDLVTQLADLHDGADGRVKDLVSATLGSAAACMGPEALLAIIPLNLDPQLFKPGSHHQQQEQQQQNMRDWLVPVLRDSVRATKLDYFKRAIAPLASAFLERAKSLYASGGVSMEAKACFVLYTQLWSTFTGFCDFPTDVETAFPAIAENLGRTINLHPDVRHSVAQGLVKLIDGLVAADPAHPYNPTRLARIKASELAAAAAAAAAAGGDGAGAGVGNDDDDDDEDEDDDEDVDRFAPKPPRKDSGAAPAALPGYAPEASVARAQLASVARFAKNFMSVIFNAICLPDADPTNLGGGVVLTVTGLGANVNTPQARACLLRAVESFSKIADPKLVNDFFRTAVKKLLEATANPAPPATEEWDNQQKLRRDMLEVSAAMVPVLDDSSASLLFRALQPLLGDSGKTIQKRAYSVLLALCRSNRSFVAGNLEAIGEIYDGGASEAAQPSSRRTRLRALVFIVAVLTPAQARAFVPRVVAEIILGTKEFNAKSRLAAYDLVIACARKYSEAAASAEDRQNAIRDFALVLVAGLGGTSSAMVSATVGCISRLLFQFSAELTPCASDLAETLLMLFDTKAREVGSALLGFCKVAFTVLSPVVLTPHVPRVVEGALYWSGHSKAFSIKVKTLLVKLVRIYGYDVIDMVVPNEHKRLIAHIRRMGDRRIRKREENAAAADKDSKDGGKDKRPQPRHSAFEALLRDSDDEGEDEYMEGEEGVDLLDSRRRLKIVKGGARQQQDAFKKGKDGRIIIEDETKKKVGGKRGREGQDDGDDDDEDGEEAGGGGGGVDDEAMDAGEGREAGRGSKKVRLSDRDREGNPRAAWAHDKERIFNSKGIQRKKGPGAGSGFAHSGTEFRSKHGKGDAKPKSSKLDPYAYVPLDRRVATSKAEGAKGAIFKQSGRKADIFSKSQAVPRTMRKAHLKRKFQEKAKK